MKSVGGVEGFERSFGFSAWLGDWDLRLGYPGFNEYIKGLGIGV